MQQVFALIALLAASTTEAVPIVGSFTEDMMCKDAVDISKDDTLAYVKDCQYDIYSDDPYKCMVEKPLGDLIMAANSWSEAKDECAAAFDKEAGDYKSAQISFVEFLGAGIGTCSSFPVAE